MRQNGLKSNQLLNYLFNLVIPCYGEARDGPMLSEKVLLENNPELGLKIDCFKNTCLKHLS